ncbi:GerAB/ArcD/ProY family transporter [Peribacillus asahii]|uniref:GerAB/ArcD/ProY family transporter n=1 Tax=Peribacillus asahii TaxID=228899 RepID=UPI00207AF0A4|nr:endospore germination permease [Peribacillus asahii]USK70926.1 endospore germination permease [Peribacillus asahii]
MVKNVKISSRQFGILVILFSIGTTILTIPTTIIGTAQQDAWISAILGIGLGLLLVALITTLASRYPNMTLVEINEKLLGRWLGKTVSLAFVFFSFISASGLLFQVGTFLTTQIMPETPIEVINFIFMCVVIMGIRLGLETLARSAEIFFAFFITLFIILVVSIAPQIDFQNIQPVFEVRMKPIIWSSLIFVSIFCLPSVVLLMVFPVSVNQPKQAKQVFYSGIIIGGLLLTIIIILCILVLGVDASSRHMYPSYVLVRKINVGNFLQRIEALMAIMWIITIYFKMIFYFYAAIIGLAQTLNVKDYRPLALPLGMIMVVMSLTLHPDSLDYNQYNRGVFMVHASTYGLFLPLLLLGISLLRKKRKPPKSIST